MFEWDPKKAISNLEKHEISFEDAASVFTDIEGLDWEDEQHSRNELRFKRLGRSDTGHILVVIYTVRGVRSGQETIRIISARQASRKEREAYSGQ